MSSRLAIFVIALLISAPAAVRAELVNMVWTDSGTFTYKTKIAAGKFVELCGPLPAGLNVEWQFRSSAPIDFNVHYHLAHWVSYSVAPRFSSGRVEGATGTG